MKLRVLVVGGCGFIGSNIVHTLQQADIDVWTLDNISTYHNTLDINLLWKAVSARTKGFKHDNINKCITDNLDAEFKEIQPHVVINLAAYPSVNLVEKYPQESLNIMGAGQLNLLDLCKYHNVKKYIYFSSSMVYGNWTSKYMSEYHKTNPINLYGKLKLFGEQLCDLYRDDMQIFILRPSAVYGSGDYSNRVLNQFCLNALQNKPLIIKGKNTFIDFTHVSQVSTAVLKLVSVADSFNWPIHNLGNRTTFNIASGCAYELTSVAKIIEDIAGKPLQIQVENKDKNQPKRGTLDTALASFAFGWKYNMDIKLGLEGLYDWTNKFYGQQTTISKPEV